MSGGKVRHKRQALQDMARPLKQWLYKHRDNPYPTKTEKILLALGSHMTLVQVSSEESDPRDTFCPNVQTMNEIFPKTETHSLLEQEEYLVWFNDMVAADDLQCSLEKFHCKLESL